MLSDLVECRQFEDTVEHAGARACERHVDFAAVWRDGDAVEAVINAERTAIYEHASDRHHMAILPHSHDRVVTTVGNVEIGTLVESRVARPPDIVRVSVGGREIDRKIEGRV